MFWKTEYWAILIGHFQQHSMAPQRALKMLLTMLLCSVSQKRHLKHFSHLMETEVNYDPQSNVAVTGDSASPLHHQHQPEEKKHN